MGPRLPQAVLGLVSARPQNPGTQGTPSEGVCLSRGAVWEGRARRDPEHPFL